MSERLILDPVLNNILRILVEGLKTSILLLAESVQYRFSLIQSYASPSENLSINAQLCN